MIRHLTVTHVLGVQRFHAQLGPVCLIAGPNAAGKSSLLHSIAYALTGKPPRGVLKKDLRDVVAEGHKAGSIEIQFDDDATLKRALPSGDPTGEAPASYQTTPLPVVLDAGAFADLDLTQRRKLLFDASGVQGSREWVAQRLAEEGIPDAIVQQTLPLLRSGFDEGSTRAAAKASEARGAWASITGETFGTKKAEGWTAPVPENPGHDVVAIEAARTQAEADAAALRERLGRLKAAGQLGDVPTPEAIERKATALADAEKRLQALEAEQATLLAASQAGSGTECACPACGAALLIDRGALKAAPPRLEGTHPAEAQSAAKDLAKRVADGRTKVSERKTELEKMRAVRTAAAALGGADNGESIAEVQQQLDKLSQDLHLYRMQLAAQRDADEARARAAETTQKAAQALADFNAWDRTAKLLAPSGLPAELLVKALTPFRAFLADGPETWPAITLTDGIEIGIGGRAYALAAESERWKADAVIAVALARLTGTPLVLLDRFDVLEPAARGDALGWFQWVAEQCGVQVIAAATLKAPVQIDGITCYWLGEEPKAKAA